MTGGVIGGIGKVVGKGLSDAQKAAGKAIDKLSGDKGEIVAMNTFGASAPAKQLFEKFGFTVNNVVEKAIASIENNQ